MPTFHLSKAQLKTIEEGDCVQVAIPLPWKGVGNPERFARHWLAVPTGWVKSVSPATIGVEPGLARPGLESQLGKIVRDPTERWQERLIQRASVLLVVLGLPGARRIVGPIQWPGSYEPR